jgi:hypothetical protein
MFKRLYHCYVAGLYDLSFDDGKSLISLADFRSEMKENLHPDDYHLASILFMPYDNKNLIRFISGKGDQHDNHGNFTQQDFEEQVELLDSIIKVENILPSYMVAVISDWVAAEKTIDLIEAEKRLTEGYFKLVKASGSKFLMKWSEFELDLNNILVLKNSMEMELDASNQIVGENQLTEELKVIARRKSDFRIPPEPDYATLIFNIAGETEFLEREIKIDQLRWNHINDLIFFEYFTIDFILGYLVKLSIALRWKELIPEKGEEMIKRLVTELKEKESNSEANES